MQLAESSLYINIKTLREKLYTCQFMMQKAERIIYGTPVMTANMNMMRCFVLAFMVKDQRIPYLNECIGWFEVLKADMDFIVKENIIKFPAPKEGVNSMKIDVFELIAMIDEDICKWRAEFVYFDRRRVCFVANEGYRHRQRICKKYGLLDPKKRSLL